MRYLLLLLLVISSAVSANDFVSPYGEWRGQTQYQAFIKSASDPAGHIVTNLTINIEPGGKLTGFSAENGCRLLGLASPGLSASILTLDVTLTGCLYEGYNRTYRGNLSVFTKDRYAKFSLQSISMTPGRPATYNITATMRR